MRIIAEITTTQAREDQTSGRIVPGDHTICPRISDLYHLDHTICPRISDLYYLDHTICPRISDLYYLDPRTPTGTPHRKIAIDPGRMMPHATPPRSRESRIRIAPYDGRLNGPDHASRTQTVLPAPAA
jgi:hypothetical protein